MRAIALLLVLLASMAYAPSAQAPPALPAQGGTTVGKTVEETANPELVGQLVKELSITPAQAEGAAGSLFGLAKNRLKPEEFAKVASAVPNMDGLLKAAPAADAKASAIDAVAGKAAGGSTGIAGLAGSFSKLGLKPDTISKLAPTLIKSVEAKGGAEIGKLLAGALQ
jgi:hypothetical protein